MGNSASGRLDGQIALVTGGAQGIGKAIATSLARDGAHVIIGDLNAQEAESIAVSMNPGATAFAVIPRLAYSRSRG